jgi:tetratricopeptide (TPR) repeat protein
MGTITAQAPAGQGTKAADVASPARTASAPDSPSRQLWQAPVLLLGAGVLAFVVINRPFGTNPCGRDIDRELTAARQEIGRSDGDAAAAAEHARRALQLADAYPDRRGEALLLLGSAEVRLADRLPDLEAAGHWQSARKHLEEADRLGVKDADRGRLQYRIGKTLFHTGADPKLVAERLAATVDMADDQAEGYGLLAEAYLRLPEPNLKEALAANEKLRKVFSISPELLALSQLQAGELLVRLDKAEPARQVLGMIGEHAPAGVLAKKRAMLARSYQAEGQWEKAAEQWRVLLVDNRDAPIERGPALYHLGTCLARLNQTEDAVAHWKECLNAGKGEEVQAAALALAEVWLQGSAADRVNAFESLRRALAGVSAPAEWKNTFVELDRLRDRLELAVQKYREALKFELALQTLDLYQRVAVTGRSALLRGDVNAEWARARRAEAGKKPAGDARASEDAAAGKLFRAAADSYLQAADEVAAEARDDAVWLAAACLLDGQDDRRAVAVLHRYIRHGSNRERVGEAWYRLGECYHKDPAAAAQAAAEESFLKCIQNQSAIASSSPVAYRARYQLALAKLARGALDDAEAELTMNVREMRKNGVPDVETLEKSVFALGRLAFRRNDFRTAESWLSGVVKADAAPTTPEGTQARFQLAESWRQLANEAQRKLLDSTARTPEEVDHLEKDHRYWLKKSADEFFELARFLDTPESAGHLTPEERIQIPFLAAICRFNLGEYATALDIYAHLAEAFKAVPMPPPTDERLAKLAKNYPHFRLEALAGVVRCHAALDQADKVRTRLEELRSMLSEVDEAVRREYEKWIVQAAKSLEMQ